jgi:hypothetical protein
MAGEATRSSSRYKIFEGAGSETRFRTQPLRVICNISLRASFGRQPRIHVFYLPAKKSYLTLFTLLHLQQVCHFQLQPSNPGLMVNTIFEGFAGNSRRIYFQYSGRFTARIDQSKGFLYQLLFYVFYRIF